MTLAVPPRAGRAWDVVALGEVMLRLDPGDSRIATAREFRVWEGGGEYNVARALQRCFGHDTAIVTALADNAVGRLIEDLMRQGGVSLQHLRWLPYDGIGQAVRNPLNFVERGFGIRAPVGVSDRAHSAASQLRPGQIEWDEMFADEGARWFHTGGIFAGLSSTTALVAREAMEAARRAGVMVSYDANYRPSLWHARGGAAAARETNRGLAPLVDVMFGTEADLAGMLGPEPIRNPSTSEPLITDRLRRTLEAFTEQFPHVSIVAATARRPISATRHDWSGVAWAKDRLYEGPTWQSLEVLDRVGSGDAFAAGVIHGLLTDHDMAWAVACGTAHGALAMTTPGDASMVTAAEVGQAMSGALAHIAR